MGLCYSAPAEKLPAATDEDIARLKGKGHLPRLAFPSVDLEGKNNLKVVYVAEYENGTELTFLFRDEDRPNPCEDCLYDTIRRPLFGRWEDIESILIINGTVEFPGTYAAEQKWKAKIPEHGHATVELDKFEKSQDNEFILWINTWNHLLGDKNNNTDMDITYSGATPDGDTMRSSTLGVGYVLRMGTREEVDARFKGCMTSVAKVMTPEAKEKLGKRLH